LSARSRRPVIGADPHEGSRTSRYSSRRTTDAGTRHGRLRRATSPWPQSGRQSISGDVDHAPPVGCVVARAGHDRDSVTIARRPDPAPPSSQRHASPRSPHMGFAGPSLDQTINGSPWLDERLGPLACDNADRSWVELRGFEPLTPSIPWPYSRQTALAQMISIMG
jgi:hypothetical protein